MGRVASVLLEDIERLHPESNKPEIVDRDAENRLVAHRARQQELRVPHFCARNGRIEEFYHVAVHLLHHERNEYTTK